MSSKINNVIGKTILLSIWVKKTKVFLQQKYWYPMSYPKHIFIQDINIQLTKRYKNILRHFLVFSEGLFYITFKYRYRSSL
jgi:hypothetical protein